MIVVKHINRYYGYVFTNDCDFDNKWVDSCYSPVKLPMCPDNVYGFPLALLTCFSCYQSVDKLYVPDRIWDIYLRCEHILNEYIKCQEYYELVSERETLFGYQKTPYSINKILPYRHFKNEFQFASFDTERFNKKGKVSYEALSKNEEQSLLEFCCSHSMFEGFNATGSSFDLSREWLDVRLDLTQCDEWGRLLMVPIEEIIALIQYDKKSVDISIQCKSLMVNDYDNICLYFRLLWGILNRYGARLSVFRNEQQLCLYPEAVCGATYKGGETFEEYMRDPDTFYSIQDLIPISNTEAQRKRVLLEQERIARRVNKSKEIKKLDSQISFYKFRQGLLSKVIPQCLMAFLTYLLTLLPVGLFLKYTNGNEIVGCFFVVMHFLWALVMCIALNWSVIITGLLSVAFFFIVFGLF